VLLVAIGGTCWSLRKHAPSLLAALTEITVAALVVSMLFGLAALLALFRSWLAALSDGGVELTARDGLRVFAVAQVGKYVPGSVWPLVAQAQLGSRLGASPGRMVWGALHSLAISVCVALVIGCALLPVVGDGLSIRMWWAPALAVPFVIVLFPPVLNRAIRVADRLLRRDTQSDGYTTRGMLTSMLWCVLANALFGLHILALAASFDRPSVHDYIVSLCTFALASAMGVLVVFAPAGAGVREAVMVVMLASIVAVPTALAIALASRAILVIGDLILAITQLPSVRVFLTEPEKDAR